MPASQVFDQLSAFLVPVRRLEERRGHVPTLLPGLNQLLGGGWPKGAVSEVAGRRSSGRTSVLHASLAGAFARGGTVALVDSDQALDPRSAEGARIPLQRLLWVHAPGLDAFRATELIVSAGGFELVAMDLGEKPPRAPDAAWLRLRRSAEKQGTVVLVVTPTPVATCAVVGLELQRAEVDFDDSRDGRRQGPPLLTAVSSAAHIRRGRAGDGSSPTDGTLFFHADPSGASSRLQEAPQTHVQLRRDPRGRSA